jgi:hypothetical protein
VITSLIRGRHQEAKATTRFDGWVRHGTLPLVNLQLEEFIYFSCYAAAGVVSSVSSFLFTLLEFYGL